MMNKKLFLVCIMIALVVAFTGCKQQRPVPENVKKMLESSSDDLVKIGIYGDALKINPHGHSYSEYAQMVNNLIQGAPLKKDKNGNFIPELFETYNCILNESGNLVITATLRPNIYWHNGSLFEIEDLWASFENMKDKTKESPYYETALGLLSYDMDETGFITLVFKGDSIKYLELLTVGIFYTKPIEIPEGLEREPAEPYEDYPVGLGSYKVVDRKLASHIILEPFDKYPLETPENRPKILIHGVHDVQDLITSVRNNKYHWVSVPSIIVDQLETMGIDNLVINKYKNDAHLLWLFNMEEENLANVKVRKALDLLVDREALKGQFPMDAKVLHASPFSETSQKADSYEVRRKEATKLLEEAGYNGDNPLKISILINEDNLARRVLADDMRKMLARANVQAKVEGVTWGEFVNERLSNKKYSTALVSYGLPGRGNWNSLLGHGQQGGALNFTGVESLEVNQALSKLNSATYQGDLDEERKVIGAYLDEHRPMAFFLTPYDVSLSMGNVKDSAEKPFHIWDEFLHWSGLFIQNR